MTHYEIVKMEFGSDVLKRIDADGKIWCLPTDPANSDYQAYLNKDNPQVEHLTEIPTPPAE
jgi:hypothetical protein